MDERVAVDLRRRDEERATRRRLARSRAAGTCRASWPRMRLERHAVVVDGLAGEARWAMTSDRQRRRRARRPSRRTRSRVAPSRSAMLARPPGGQVVHADDRVARDRAGAGRGGCRRTRPPRRRGTSSRRTLRRRWAVATRPDADVGEAGGLEPRPGRGRCARRRGRRRACASVTASRSTSRNSGQSVRMASASRPPAASSGVVADHRAQRRPARATWSSATAGS